MVGLRGWFSWSFFPHFFAFAILAAVCPKILDTIQIVTHYTNWAKTSWTYSTADLAVVAGSVGPGHVGARGAVGILVHYILNLHTVHTRRSIY